MLRDGFPPEKINLGISQRSVLHLKSELEKIQIIDDKKREEIKKLIYKLNSTSDIAKLLDLPEDKVGIEVEKLTSSSKEPVAGCVPYADGTEDTHEQFLLQLDQASLEVRLD